MRVLSFLLCLFTVSSVIAQPLVLNGKIDLVIKGQTFSNPTGDCVSISNSKNIVLENCSIGPCLGNGVNVVSSSNVAIVGSAVNNATGNGIQAGGCNQISILKNIIMGGKSSVYVAHSTIVKVERNHMFNTLGPRPRGNFVQFNNVNGGGNRIKCNTGINIPGHSFPEDEMNLYQCTGLATDPIQVVGNKIIGGGPSTVGGGILLGDQGGAYQIGSNNVLVNPGQYGIAIAGGNNMKLLNNTVYSNSYPFSNIGIYVWNQGGITQCHSNTVQGNKVNYYNKLGNLNGAWNGGNCGTITGWSNNNFSDRSVTETSSFAGVPSVCLQD